MSCRLPLCEQPAVPDADGFAEAGFRDDSHLRNPEDPVKDKALAAAHAKAFISFHLLRLDGHVEGWFVGTPALADCCHSNGKDDSSPTPTLTAVIRVKGVGNTITALPTSKDSGNPSLIAERDMAAANRYFDKAIGANGKFDKSGANKAAIDAINAGRDVPIVERQVKYPDNIVAPERFAATVLRRLFATFAAPGQEQSSTHLD